MDKETDEPKKDIASISSKLRKILQTTRQMPRLFMLVWRAHPGLASVFLVSEIILGLVPLATVWSVKLLVDSVPAVVASFSQGAQFSLNTLPSSIPMALSLISLAWFVSEISRPIEEYCKEQLNDFLNRDINLMLMDKVNSIVDISILENPQFYDKLQRIQNEIAYKPMHMIHVYSQLGQASISMISLSIVLLGLNPWLVVLMLVVAAPKIYMQLKQMYQMWDIIWGDAPELRRMRYFTGVLTNNLDGKEIRLFGLGSFFRGNYLELFKKFQAQRANLRNSHLFWNVLLAAFSTVGTTLSYVYAVWETINGRITTGMMAMYLSTIGQMESHFGHVAFLIAEMYKNTLYVNELFEFMEIPPAVNSLAEGTAKKVPMPLKQGVEFRNVSFKYPNNDSYVLKNVSFKISPGETVALVGENGAGKTTIVKLLSRLYDPVGGEILVDGINLCELDATHWRSQMSVVFQDYCKFQLTARENIGIGNMPHIRNQEAVQIAAERGGAAAVISKLTDGYETMLGKQFEHKRIKADDDSKKESQIGTELSGGEWQKVALSRAFMRSTSNTNGNSENQAQLLILDEPTASLDVQSEYDVYCRFHELTEGKMALLITHRFSTVRIADKIIVLEGGQIIEEGSHDELMSSETNYFKLYNLQADRYK